MPPPSAVAERLATHWVADALAAEQSIDFSVIKALVDVSSEHLVGAPDAARERVALRCLQEFAAFADADEGGSAAAPAPAEMLRIDAALSCEELLVELMGQVESSRSFDNDVILPFRQDIQNFICIKKPTLPETSLELLRGVDLEIQCMVAPSPVEENGINKHSNHQPLCNVNHPHSNIEKPRLPTVSTELQSENLINTVNETEIGNFQQCPIKPTVDLDQRLETDSRFYNQPQEDVINATSVGARSTGLNLQAAPESHRCNVILHDKISEAHCSSEQGIGKNTTDIEKRSCNMSVPNSSQNGNRKTAKQNSNKQTVGETVPETSHVPSSHDISSGSDAACLLSMTRKIPLCSQHQEANDPLGISSEQDLCIKCGKDGQLLQCSSCLLSAHDSCFGSSVTFEHSGLFYCPVCICTKATEAYQKAKKTYIEARKKLVAFLGAEQLLKQHDKQQTGVLPRAANSEDSSEMKNSCSQTKGDDLAHQDEESDRQRKKQKINVTSDANEVAIEETSFVRNSDVAPINKHSVLQNNSNKLQDAEQDHVENTEAHEDAGNGYLSGERRNSSQNTCSAAANLEAEADKEDGPTNSHQSEDTDDIEATSSSDSGKIASPPWRTIKHHKARPQEREATVSSNPTKAFRQKDQHVPSPSKKQNYAYPPKRYSNPDVPTGRRSKLCWTIEEETALMKAMEKFSPRDNGPIPWVQILEHNRNVFHRTRLPCDLRVKWRNMQKKAGS